MILTQCAVCATELGLTLGKKCGRCSTRYCGPECQVQHWKEGGHDQICKKIKKAGGAEQYNADKKCAEAVAVAVEACAEDTKGQTCYICTQALHWKTKEGLVRMCACRGTAGFAHVSCLAEQAKILCDEAEERNLFGTERGNSRWDRWNKCSLCEQKYHGVVVCALGWACWKTYVARNVGRPQADMIRCLAMGVLGIGLYSVGHSEDALSVQEAQYPMMKRLGAPEQELLTVQCNLASTYLALGRDEDCLRVRRDVYSGRLKLLGDEHLGTLSAAHNYTSALHLLKRYEEAKAFTRKVIPVARRVLGESHEITLKMRWCYAEVLHKANGATLDDNREAAATLEEVARTARRVLGGAHPFVGMIERALPFSRALLRSSETSRGA
ncbi:unnamed protein product [Pelagomonas calceolata]|uniref:MYND-type domain-containing protein n=1 Tax=Pelagomonas calceolata TaxID=35677 RepID=A0A8J2T0M1_9STRA|nr:unnamed protein product [Pelagomonas calceolata]